MTKNPFALAKGSQGACFSILVLQYQNIKNVLAYLLVLAVIVFFSSLTCIIFCPNL